MTDRDSNVLAVIAHPDDEIFLSGTLCFLAAHGVAVDLICITDGEGADADARPEARKALGRQRLEELHSSSAILGIRNVIPLHFPDTPDPKSAWDMAALRGIIEQAIRTTSPDLILTHGPGGGYGHMAHVVANEAVMSAAAEFQGSIFSFGGQVPGTFFSWQFDEVSDVLVDARPFLEQRIKALECHKSQICFYLQPAFPSTVRKYLSALLGYLLLWTEWGRKRIPIGTPSRFFRRFPIEGLVMQRPPRHGPSYFAGRFSDEVRVFTVRKSN